MPNDQIERLLQQFAAGREFVPGRGTARMRQRNQIEGASGAANTEAAANELLESRERNKLPDREFPDWNDEPRLQDFDLAVKPRRAVCNLLPIWDTIGATGRFARKTAADRGEVDLGPHHFLAQPGRFFKPVEKCLARSPGERSCGQRLAPTTRLSDKNDSTNDCAARNGRRLHSRAASTIAQARHVFR